ncbi:MAG: DUF6531 domain-containing protein, partial [Defluviitaleaceae bacterium]|nr:DUF6531 domain-containing protein [Defluviitaleaceae bacterium]
SIGRALVVLAVVAVVTVAVVGTGGAALAVVAGAAAVLTAVVVHDYINQENSSWGTFFLAGITGAVVGAKLFTLFGGVMTFTPAFLGAAQTIGAIGATATGVIKKFGDTLNKKAKGLMQKAKELTRKLGKQDPVDLVTGMVYYDIIDFEYTGILPFQWERTYNTRNTNNLSPLGYGMSNLYLMHIKENCGAIEYNNDTENISLELYHSLINKEGREIPFFPLEIGEEVTLRYEKLKISYNGTSYTVFDYDLGEYYTFTKKDNENNYTLDKIENETKSHKIALTYTNGNLSLITDSVGREFKITTNQNNLITKITLDNKILIQYEYNEHKDLVILEDVNGNVSKIEYKNHLIIKRITKENNIFNWKYDGNDHTAKCIHTWGDNGLLEGHFKYNSNNTEFINGLSEKTIVYFDEDKNITKIIEVGKVLTDENNQSFELENPRGDTTTYTYTEYNETESITNPDGEKTTYAYNDLGQVTEITLPSGATQKLDYDEKGKLIKSISPTGLTTEWIYNEQGNISEIKNPNGVLEKHEYNENGLLISIIEEVDQTLNTSVEEINTSQNTSELTNKIQNITKFSYDNHSNITEITYPNNAIEKFTYDDEGNCTSHINPLGAVEKMKYDTANRLIEHTAPDGNITKLKYNSYTDVIYLKDNTKELNFTYTALGSIASRKEQQRITHFKYDTEEQLTQVINEKGEKYTFERNHQGNVTTETGFDNVRKSYTYTPAGKLKGMRRGNTSDWLRMKYDKAGYLSKIIYDNGGEDLEEDIFTHGKLGELLKAESKNSTLAFEYDKFGNVIKEIQNGKEIISEYNSPLYPFARTKLQTSLGLDINTTVNEFGQTTEITADFESFTNHYSNIKNSNNNLNSENRLHHLWNIKQTFNPIGQLLERNIQVSPTKANQTKPTEIKDSWNYNNQGLPTTKTLKTNINNRE